MCMEHKNNQKKTHPNAMAKCPRNNLIRSSTSHMARFRRTPPFEKQWMPVFLLTMQGAFQTRLPNSSSKQAPFAITANSHSGKQSNQKTTLHAFLQYQHGPQKTTANHTKPPLPRVCLPIFIHTYVTSPSITAPQTLQPPPNPKTNTPNPNFQGPYIANRLIIIFMM